MQIGYCTHGVYENILIRFSFTDLPCPFCIGCVSIVENTRKYNLMLLSSEPKYYFDLQTIYVLQNYRSVHLMLLCGLIVCYQISSISFHKHDKCLTINNCHKACPIPPFFVVFCALANILCVQNI